jgi:hypothetical protein
MNTKSLVLLTAMAGAAVVSFNASAEAQGRRYWQPDPGYQQDYRGGYQGGGRQPDYGYAPRGRCLSSDGINDSLARNGWYPLANVGGSPDGSVIHMRVGQGHRQLIAAVDGCSGRILKMWG